jgi:DnaJ like chaperone protein
MFWLGKFLGALFGYLIGGSFGAVLGLLLGHYFDVSRKELWFFNPPPRGHTHAQDIFFRATFTIMGYIAKADGRISENEIRVAQHIMQNMMLTPALRQQAIQYFQLGKQANFSLDEILSQLNNACYHQPNLLHLFLEIQLQAAYADGVLSVKKQRILEQVCYGLGMDPGSFFAQQAYGSYRQQQYRQSAQQPSVDHLAVAYRLLGVAKSNTDAEIKKAYRKLMSQNHPDKLVSKGLPEEMIKLATEKTVEIKTAYELICKSRGI